MDLTDVCVRVSFLLLLFFVPNDDLKKKKKEGKINPIISTRIAQSQKGLEMEWRF